MTILRSLGLDLLAYQVHGRIRNTIISTRTILNPVDGTITNIQKMLAVSEVFSFTPPAIASGFVLRSSEPVTVAVTLSRTPSNVVATLNCNGLLVLTDTVVSATITNPSDTLTADISIASI